MHGQNVKPVSVAVAYQPTREKSARFNSNAFKIGLVAMDCVFLGEKEGSEGQGIQGCGNKVSLIMT